MQARCVRKYIRTSPRKLRTIVNAVRGKNVAEALAALTFLPQQATVDVDKAVRSAYHNLVDQNPDIRFDEEDLFIQEIRVDEGPMLKRFRPASRGRAHPYRRRMSHLTVVVAEREVATEEA